MHPVYIINQLICLSALYNVVNQHTYRYLVKQHTSLKHYLDVPSSHHFCIAHTAVTPVFIWSDCFLPLVTDPNLHLSSLPSKSPCTYQLKLLDIVTEWTQRQTYTRWRWPIRDVTSAYDGGTSGCGATAIWCYNIHSTSKHQFHGSQFTQLTHINLLPWINDSLYLAYTPTVNHKSTKLAAKGMHDWRYND